MRETVVGSYSGIKVETYWTGVAGSGLVHDTSQINVSITKSSQENVIIFGYNQESFLFTFKNGIFTSTESYHPPSLRKSLDSLYFNYQPGLGPDWTDCIVKKQL